MKSKKILCFLVGGLGNVLLFTPVVRILKNICKSTTIDVLTSNKKAYELLKNCTYINKIYVLDDKIQKTIKKILLLRSKKYDTSMIGFPSNTIKRNLIMFIINAKKRISHSHNGFKDIRHLNFLNNIRIKIKDLHDIDQNLNLLEPLKINLEKIQSNLKKIKIYTKKEESFVKKFLLEHNITKNDFIVGIHPGCDPGSPFKRWEVEKFIELGKKIQKKYKSKIFLFIGPSEKDLLNKIKNINKNFIIIKNTALPQTINLIKRCNLFVSNDSGLMHIAVALNKKALGIYGPSDPRRTAPYKNMNNTIQKGLKCQPCNRTLKYLNLEGKFKCIYNGKEEPKCLKKLDVDEVFKKIKRRIKS